MKALISFKVIVLVVFIPMLLFPWVPARAIDSTSLPAFTEFVSRVTDGQVGVVSGVYVPGVLAEKVVQQIGINPGYVSRVEDVVTQFRMAMSYGVIGLLAHDTLAGETFINLRAGQEVRIIYGDGKVSYYAISSINSYEALDSESTRSNFIDINTGKGYTTALFFAMYYQGGDHVIFQTCIAKDGNLSWGRLIITAVPIKVVLTEVEHPTTVNFHLYIQ
jgi:hypothetical protein